VPSRAAQVGGGAGGVPELAAAGGVGALPSAPLPVPRAWGA
jgi:hypothetical protein